MVLLLGGAARSRGLVVAAHGLGRTAVGAMAMSQQHHKTAGTPASSAGPAIQKRNTNPVETRATEEPCPFAKLDPMCSPSTCPRTANHRFSPRSTPPPPPKVKGLNSLPPSSCCVGGDQKWAV